MTAPTCTLCGLPAALLVVHRSGRITLECRTCAVSAVFYGALTRDLAVVALPAGVRR